VTLLVLACVYFVGVHLLIAGTTVRDRIASRVGEQGYLGIFSLLSLVGIVWMCVAWSRAEPMAPLWSLPSLRPAVLVVMFFAFQLAAIGLTTRSPTATGGEKALEAEEPAHGILRVTRHPFLWGVTLWAACHLALNADPPSLAFFGALLTLGLTGPPSIDRKRARKLGDSWQRFAEVTSNVPFAAIATGRNQLRLGELGLIRIAIATALYAVFLGFHARLFGANPFPV
jgi:uncharacterized membrane protein